MFDDESDESETTLEHSTYKGITLLRIHSLEVLLETLGPTTRNDLDVKRHELLVTLRLEEISLG